MDQLNRKKGRKLTSFHFVVSNLLLNWWSFGFLFRISIRSNIELFRLTIRLLIACNNILESLEIILKYKKKIIDKICNTISNLIKMQRKLFEA